MKRRENPFKAIGDNDRKLLTGAKNSSFPGIFAFCQVTTGKQLNSLKILDCDDSAQQKAPEKQPKSPDRRNKYNQQVKTHNATETRSFPAQILCKQYQNTTFSRPTPP